MSEQQGIDFQALCDQVSKPAIEPGAFAFWGGTCTETELLAFLRGWGLPRKEMPYCIWEYASEIIFDEQSLPGSDKLYLLQAGRVFGHRGDLALRREEGGFAWRYIGQAETRPPAGHDHEENDYWSAEPQARLHHYDGQHALLWGEWSPSAGRWFEDRVARANLSYPVVPADRVWLEYETFSRNGVIEFVWYKKLLPWQDQAAGKQVQQLGEEAE